MADSVGVLIDGKPVGPPSGRSAGRPRPSGSDGGEPAGGASDGGEPDGAFGALLRRRLLQGLAVLLIAALALSTLVGQLRNDAIPGEGRAGLLRGIDPCPAGRDCAISDQAGAQMWDAAYRAFPDYIQVSATAVFDARTGTSYSESMTMSKDGIVIRLTATRAPGSAPREMFVDVTSASAEGMVVTGVPADGTPDRLVTAALSGPEDALLPVDAAIAWASTLDLFGDMPR